MLFSATYRFSSATWALFLFLSLSSSSFFSLYSLVSMHLVAFSLLYICVDNANVIFSWIFFSMRYKTREGNEKDQALRNKNTWWIFSSGWNGLLNIYVCSANDHIEMIKFQITPEFKFVYSSFSQNEILKAYEMFEYLLVAFKPQYMNNCSLIDSMNF